MILNCEACGKRYMIKDGVITNTPKKVRCTSCGHTWTAYPDPSNIPEQTIIARNDKSQPESKDNKFTIILTSLVIAAICSFLLLGRFEIVKYIPASKIAYDALSISTQAPGSGLKLSDIHAIAGLEQGIQQIKISGTITNTTKSVIHVPLIEFNIMGKCGKESSTEIILGYIGMGQKKINGACVIKSWTLPLRENKILAGEKVNFVDIKKLPDNATSIIVRF